MTVNSVHCCLGTIPTVSPPSQQSVFNRLSARTSEKSESQKKATKVVHLATTFINMISRGRDLFRSRRRRRETFTPPASSPDFDYSPGLSQVLVEQEGAFQGTRSRVAISYNYCQPSSSTGDVSPAPLRNLFQWSDNGEEASGYASSATISSVRRGFVSANMADNNDDDLRRRMETSRLPRLSRKLWTTSSRC